MLLEKNASEKTVRTYTSVEQLRPGAFVGQMAAGLSPAFLVDLSTQGADGNEGVLKAWCLCMGPTCPGGEEVFEAVEKLVSPKP